MRKRLLLLPRASRPAAAPRRSHGRGPAIAVIAAAGLGVLAAAAPQAAILLLVLLVGAAAVLIFRRFDLLLHALILSVFVESIGFGAVRVGRLLAVVAIVTIVGRLLFTAWRPRTFRPGPALLPAVMFAVWAWASGLWAANTQAWLFALGQLGLAAAYFAAFTLFVERREQIRPLLRTYVLGALFAAAVAFAQVALGADRAVGLQGDANIYAMYQVAALPAAAMLATTAAVGQRWFGYAAIPVLLASVIATQSRGGVVTALAVLLLLALRGDLGHRLRRYRTTAVAGGVAVGVGLLAISSSFSNRFSVERVASDRASGRLDIWYVAVREWQDNVLLGIGAGGFKPRSVELLVTEPGVELIKSHLLLSSGIEVHNIYLETLVEYGVVGSGLFVAVLLLTGRSLWRASRLTGDPAVRALGTMLVAFLAASFFLSVVNNKLLWFLVATGVVLGGRPLLPTLPPGRAAPGPASPATDVSRALRSFPRPLLAGGLVLSLVAATVAVSATAWAPDRYTSTLRFVVNTGAGPGESESIVRTLESLVASDAVAADVIELTGIPLSPYEVTERISVTRQPATLTFSAELVDEDQQRSAQLAGGLVAAFTSRVDALRPAASAGVPARYDLVVWGGDTIMTMRLPAPLQSRGLLGLSLGAALAMVLALAESLLPPAGAAAGRASGGSSAGRSRRLVDV